MLMMAKMGGMLGGDDSGGPSAWSTTDKAAGAVLSNNNRTVTCGASAGARGTRPAQAGNRHMEFLVASATICIGLAPPTDNLDASSWNTTGLKLTGGAYYNQGSPTSGAPTYVSGDVIGLDYNGSTGAFTLSKNGTIFASNSTAASLLWLPWSGRASIAMGAVTINTGQDPFTSNPNGVLAWG